MTVFRTHYIADVKKARTPVQRAVLSHAKRDFFCVSNQLQVQEVITMLKASPLFSSSVHVIALINDRAEYQGLVSISRLLCADKTQPVTALVQGSNHYTFALSEAYPAALQLRKSQWPVLPILDSRHRVVGVLELNAARAIIRHQLELNDQGVAKTSSGWKRFVRFWKH
ncbi:CBS domain-containing protein [Vibrio metschnikovii]|uniref:magnesium transporter n=1 Tax=Vibrio metschnikovii TaxID=28172 RepID=UPI001646F259|nr:magnesium transporter [Vibrio metschnikovii]MBC3620408.1 magnesium transporter [Vibrio metschnikovii]